MIYQMLTFLGEGFSPREALYHAINQLNTYLAKARIDPRDLDRFDQHMSSVTLGDDITWHYIITLFFTTSHGVNLRLMDDIHPAPTSSIRTRTESQERAMVIQANRRARAIGAEGYFSYEHWVRLRRHFGDACLACTQAFPLTIDHVEPLSTGGTNWISNIQPLCKSCNSIKHQSSTDHRDPTLLKAFLAGIS